MTPNDIPTAFVIMPFDEGFTDLYELAIKGACEAAGIACSRVDEQHIDEHIVETIYQNIRSCDLIIADLTGSNSNVYYELGYAKAHGKRILAMTQNIEELKFDFRSYNVLRYEKNKQSELKEKLTRQISTNLSKPAKGFDILDMLNQSSDVQTRMKEYLEDAKSSIIFSGAHFGISASDQRSRLISKLCDGVNITYHVIEPGSPAVGLTAKAYGMREPELERECESGLEVLRGLAEEATSAGAEGKLKVFTSIEQPQARYMLFDHLEERGKVIVTPYVDGLRSSHTPTYVFRAQASCAQTYSDCCRRAIKQSALLDLT